MKQIKKGKEPTSLTEHKQKEFATYDNYGDKDALRLALVKEQRGICCYCMGSIAPNRKAMKIEHFKDQKGHDELQLAYTNMLGACLGNMGSPRKMQHCDTYKGKATFSTNPTNQAVNIEQLIRYSPDGRIYSDDKHFDEELNKVLNLNVAFLKNNRKAALDLFRKDKLSKKGKINQTRSGTLAGQVAGNIRAGRIEPVLPSRCVLVGKTFKTILNYGKIPYRRSGSFSSTTMLCMTKAGVRTGSVQVY